MLAGIYPLRTLDGPISSWSWKKNISRGSLPNSPSLAADKRIYVLDIPDEYKYMDPRSWCSS